MKVIMGVNYNMQYTLNDESQTRVEFSHSSKSIIHALQRWLSSPIYFGFSLSGLMIYYCAKQHEKGNFMDDDYKLREIVLHFLC